VDGLLVVGAAALHFAPELFNLKPDPPDCLPCDPSGVPWFDRWAIAEPRADLSAVSDVLLLGLGAFTLVDLAQRQPNGFEHAAATLESAAVAGGLTTLLKAVIGRPRPILYTDAALSLDDPAAARVSMPSGHTSTAVALAASYVLAGSRTGRGTPGALQLGTIAAAAIVGGLRIASASHFPSDVVAGAAVGVGSSFVVEAIRF
jgi:membrane-associated phospholipid phosphatase